MADKSAILTIIPGNDIDSNGEPTAPTKVIVKATTTTKKIILMPSKVASVQSTQTGMWSSS